MPVNKLPPELLSKVLEYRSKESDLVAATHVCQCWRSTLISSPSLWNRVRVFSRRKLNRPFTYLERSKSALIDVYINVWSSETCRTLGRLAPHIQRTRSLEIHGSPTNILATSFLFHDSTPSLQRLEIYSRESPVGLPDAFFNKQLPSLHSVTFEGIFPMLDSPPPFPNLTRFELYLSSNAPPRMSLLFRFLSGCPRIQKIWVNVHDYSEDKPEDGPLDRIISLEFLTELDYNCTTVSRVLSYLNLPRLERLRVAMWMKQTRKLADILPRNSYAFLAGVTKMQYRVNRHCHGITEFSRDGTNVSLTATPPVDVFSDESPIPFGQIEDLEIKGDSTTTDLPIVPIDVFQNLRIFRVDPWDMDLSAQACRLLLPGAGMPCPNLREIRYSGSPGPLINLAEARFQAGRRLGLVQLRRMSETWRGSVEELRELVGEVLVE